MKSKIIDVVKFYEKYPQFMGSIKVNTPYGYKTIEGAELITEEKTISIITKKNKKLECSVNHRIKNVTKRFKYAKNFIVGDKILTVDGIEPIIKIIRNNNVKKLYDIQVEKVKQYYSNGIISHNSALFGDALLFSLFGKTGKNLKKANIVNRIIGKKCTGEVWFSTGGFDYHVTNGAAPAYCAIERLEDGEWKSKTKSTMGETQTYLCDEILRSTYMMFKKMNVLSISDNESIYEMGKSDKRTFIENVFNLNVFGEMFKMVKIDYNKIDKLILQEQSKFTQLEKDVLIYSEKIKSFQTEKDAHIESLNTQINTIKTNNKTLLLEFVDVDIEITKLKDTNDTLFKKWRTIQDALNKLENSIIESESKLEFERGDITKYESIYEMVCDTCKGKLDDVLGFTDNKNALDALEATIKASKTKYTTLKEARNKITEKRENNSDTIDELNTKKSDYALQQRKIDGNNAKLELLSKNLKDEENKTSSFDDLYEKYNTEKDELYVQLSEKLDKRKYLSLLKNVLSEDGVKKHIIATLINALNNRIASYLEEMGSEYTVIFDPNFECKFWTTTGECEFNNFSAGEKMRLNHATMFAFQDIISTQGNLKTNILYCDELIDVSVDTVAIEAFMNILRRKTENGQTIYLISHREAISEDEFDNVIEVKKEGGFTQIVSDPQGTS